MYKRQIYQIAESNRIDFFCPNWNALPSPDFVDPPRFSLTERKYTVLPGLFTKKELYLGRFNTLNRVALQVRK